MVRPWARGEPPPQGSLSSLFLAMAMDLEGGRRTSACSPLKGMMATWRTEHISRLKGKQGGMEGKVTWSLLV